MKNICVTRFGKATNAMFFLLLVAVILPVSARAQDKHRSTPQCQGCGSAQVPNPPDSLCLYWRALAYDGVDPLKERDSMKAYCEQHPFAVYGYGMWRSAVNYVMTAANDYWVENIQQQDSVWSWNYWATLWNWYVKIQPMNPDSIYQRIVMFDLAGIASAFDLNLSCNLFYNSTLLFPHDSLGNVEAWEAIRLLRRQQSEIPEDTTAYSVLTFPLTPLLVAGVQETAMPSGPMHLELYPNPAGNSVILNYEVPTPVDASLMLLDVTGKDVKNLGVVAGSPQANDLNIGTLPNGHYFVRLASGGVVVTKELVVRH